MALLAFWGCVVRGSWLGLVALDESVAGLDAVEVREGLFELVVDDLVFLDVEPMEDGLVEQAALVAAAELQANLGEPCAVGEVLVGVVEAFGRCIGRHDGGCGPCRAAK
jgi:hypothetical protein